MKPEMSIPGRGAEKSRPNTAPGSTARGTGVPGPEKPAQASDCSFCAIVAGDAPANILAAWDDAIVFHPLNPVTAGHVLVVPTVHVDHFAEVPSVTAAVMGRAASFVAHSVIDYNLITSKGPAATQTVQHLHVHLVPRRPGDGLALPWTGQADRDAAVPHITRQNAQSLRAIAEHRLEHSTDAVDHARAEGIAEAAEDPNAFWRLQSGDHLNLLDEAIEQIDALTVHNGVLVTEARFQAERAEEYKAEVDRLRSENAELLTDRSLARRIASQAIANGERMSAGIERIGAQVGDLIAAVRGLSVPAGDHSTEYLSGYADALFVARDVLGVDTAEDARSPLLHRPRETPMPDPTAAEQAAAEVLAERHNARSTTDHLSTAAFAGEARAVVEAVRPILTAETLDDAAEALAEVAAQKGREPYVTSQRLRFGLTSGAQRLRDRAAAARQSGEGQ